MGLADHEFNISPEQAARLLGPSGNDGARLRNLQDEVGARAASLRNAVGTIAGTTDLRTVGRRRSALPARSGVGGEFAQDPILGAARGGGASHNGFIIGGGMVGFGAGLFNSKGPGGNPAGQSAGAVPSRLGLEQAMDLNLQHRASLDSDRAKLVDRFNRTGAGAAELEANANEYDAYTKDYLRLGATLNDLYGPFKNPKLTPPPDGEEGAPGLAPGEARSLLGRIRSGGRAHRAHGSERRHRWISIWNNSRRGRP